MSTRIFSDRRNAQKFGMNGHIFGTNRCHNLYNPDKSVNLVPEFETDSA